VLRVVSAFVGVFAGVLAILLVAVGQLGKVDRQTLAAILVAATAAAVVAAARARRD
jgi:hypothetical protein